MTDLKTMEALERLNRAPINKAATLILRKAHHWVEPKVELALATLIDWGDTEIREDLEEVGVFNLSYLEGEIRYLVAEAHTHLLRAKKLMWMLEESVDPATLAAMTPEEAIPFLRQEVARRLQELS